VEVNLADILVVQWLRARFNECYEKADWAKARCADELPFIERLLHDKARETVSLSFQIYLPEVKLTT
jgi:hypothetical protein